MAKKSKSLYSQSWLVILLIVFIFPVGLFLMWKYTSWAPLAKWLVTIAWGGFCTLFWTVGIVGSLTANPPTIGFKALSIEAVNQNNQITLEGKVIPSTSIVKVDGKQVKVNSQGIFAVLVPLQGGDTKVNVEADNFGKKTTRERIFSKTPTALSSSPTPSPSLVPSLTPTPQVKEIPKKAFLSVESPEDGITVNEEEVEVRGKAFPSSSKVKISYGFQSTKSNIGKDGSFSKKIKLKEGDNKLTINVRKGWFDNKKVIRRVKYEKLKEPEKPKEPDTVDVNANIKFNYLFLMVTNQDSVAWNNCKLELNSGVVRGGYSFSLASLAPAQETSIPLSEFTKGDGTRFNGVETKPKKLSISCADVGGKQGFGFYGSN